MSELGDTATELTASQMLSEARVAMGLSQEEVAQELFLIPNYIRWIDGNQIEKIDKQAFVRGYLRSYAKLVGLDGNDMVARFEKTQDAPPQKIEIRGVTQESVGSTSFTGPVVQTGVIGLLGFVVVVGLVWFFVSSDEVSEPEFVVTANTAEVNGFDGDTLETVSENELTDADLNSDLNSDLNTDPGSELGGGTSEDNIEPINTASTRAAAPADRSDALGTNENEILLADSAPTQDIAAAAESNARELTESPREELTQGNEQQVSVERSDDAVYVDAGGEDELRFAFSDECWIEIEDASGSSIYENLLRDGDELVVRGVAPFEVLFGKAPAVRMTFNGESFDLEPHTTAVDTAKVKIGS